MAHIYGKFVSSRSAQVGCSLEALSEDACASAVPLVRLEIAKRYANGHRCLSILTYGERSDTCWFAPDAWYLYRSCRYQAGVSTGLVYDVSPRLGADPGFDLPRFVCALEDYLINAGKNRTLIFLEQKLSQGQVEATRLHLVGECSSSRASLVGFALKEPARSLSDSIKSILRSKLPLLSSAAYHAIRIIKPPVFELSGSISGKKSRALFLGPEGIARFYSGLLFDPCDPLRALPSNPLSRQGQVPEGFDFVITHRSEPGPAEPGEIAMPSFIRSISEVPDDEGAFLKTICYSARSDIKKIKRERYVPEISKDPLDIILFYHSMHLPMVDNRHKNRATHFTFPDLESAFSDGFLIFVKRDGICLGGMVVSESEDRLRMRFLGILDGSFRHTQAGVNSALMYFIIIHAIDHGYPPLDFGQSAALKGDGVAWFKEKWGARHMIDRDGGVLSIRFRDDHLKKHFLERLEPFSLADLSQNAP